MILFLFIMVVLMGVFTWIKKHFPFLELKLIEKKSSTSRVYAIAKLMDTFRMMFFGMYFLGVFYFSSHVPYTIGLFTADPFPLIKIFFYIYLIGFGVQLLFYGVCLLKAYLTETD